MVRTLGTATVLFLMVGCSGDKTASPASQPSAPPKIAQGESAAAKTGADSTRPEPAIPGPAEAPRAGLGAPPEEAEPAPAPAQASDSAPAEGQPAPEAPPLPHGTVTEQAAQPAPPPGAEPTPQPRTRPKLCEVEMTGAIELPAGTRKPEGRYVIYISDGDCLADDARILQRVVAADQGTFFVEEFSPCGVKLQLCASIEPNEPGSATRWTGRLANPIDAEGEGEIYVNKLVIPLKKGKPHTFPPRIAPH